MDLVVYLFSIDDSPLYLVNGQDVLDLSSGRLEYAPIHILTLAKSEWLYFAAVTVSHLGQWYTKNKYCGRCGDAMEQLPEQRAIVWRTNQLFEYLHRLEDKQVADEAKALAEWVKWTIPG